MELTIIDKYLAASHYNDDRITPGIYGSSITQGRSTMHHKFDLIRVRNHDIEVYAPDKTVINL